MSTKTQSPLKGLYFISNDADGKARLQGQVLDELAPSYYLLQLYSWLDGEPTELRSLSLAEMRGYQYFTDVERWQEAGTKALKAGK